jgi:hypothetical protein
MKQIRNSVFETNSSSTHSISISGSSFMHIPKVPLFVSFGEYGWGYDEYNDPEDKLSYILTAAQYYTNEYDWKKKNYDAIFDSKWVKWIREMVRDYCGQEIEISLNEDTYYPTGYIDHQSTDTLDQFWTDDEKQFKENMKQIVFNMAYTVVIDNDNN